MGKRIKTKNKKNNYIMDRTDFLIHTGTNKSDTRFFHEILNSSSSICLFFSMFLVTLFNN
jgi:hypothetical protein